MPTKVLKVCGSGGKWQNRNDGDNVLERVKCFAINENDKLKTDWIKRPVTMVTGFFMRLCKNVLVN